MRDQPTFRPSDRASFRSQAPKIARLDLVVVASPVEGALGHAVRLGDGPRALGRLSDAHGEDDWMSREHATAHVTGGVAKVRDGTFADGAWKPSANGTFLVDDRSETQVTAEVEVRPGQLVRTGRSLWCLVENLAPTPPGSLLVGISDAMGRVRDEVALVVAEVALRMDKQKRVTQSLLVTGERGTGKQVVAREAHRLLAARRQTPAIPFVDVPAPALADGTSAADVFGVVDKYATDVKGRPGYFERANGGVLLIDEVADLPLAEQAKLLNVLEERQVTRLGAKTPVAFDCLVVAATNRDLDGMVQSGAFRADLLDRLRRFHVHLPSLSDRREDVLPLTVALMRRHAYGAPLVADVAVEVWRRGWPGSVRELDAFVERLIALARNAGKDEIDRTILDRALRSLRSTLPAVPTERRPRATVPERPAPIEGGRAQTPSREELLQRLEENGWNKTEVGRLYGKHPRQITRWMEYLDITRPGES